MGTSAPPTWCSKTSQADALNVYLLGVVEFEAAMHVQERLLEDAIPREDLRGNLLICEHPPIITIGRDGSRRDVHASEHELQVRRIPVRHVNRGGGTLVHGPGQLAAYPVLPIERRGWTVSELHARYEQAIVQTAGELHVVAEPVALPVAHPSNSCNYDLGRRADVILPGVRCRCGQFAWTAAAVRCGMSFQGMFVNVSIQRDLMRLVRSTSVGIRYASLVVQRERPVAMHCVRESLIRNLAQRLGYQSFHVYTGHPLLRRTRRKVAQYV